MAVVYLHRTKDSNEVFYVGIGNSEKRPFQKHSRTVFWKNIVNKHGLLVEITHKNIIWEEAQYIEKYLISFWREVSKVKLCNLTDGGGGCENLKLSDEIIKKRNKAIKEAWDQNRKLKYKEAFKGEKNPFFGKKHSPESRLKISENKTPHKFISEKHKQNISKANKGKILTQETREKISKSKIGKQPPNKGKCHTQETKEKIRQKVKLLYINEGYRKMISEKTKEAYKNNPALKQKISERLRGKPSPRKGIKLTQEQKDRLSELNKGKKISEDQKIKISLFHKGRKRSEETKKKISDAIKQFHKKRNTWN